MGLKGLDENYVRGMAQALVECAVWTHPENDEGVNEVEQANAGWSEVMGDDEKEVLDECRAFAALAGEDLDDIPATSAGHNFWLSRNGHGTGFWDRGWEDKGDRLHELARSFGEADLHLSEEGTLSVRKYSSSNFMVKKGLALLYTEKEAEEMEEASAEASQRAKPKM